MIYPYSSTYSPFGNYYPQAYQPIQTTPQTVQNQNSIIWIGNQFEAQSYPVAPNNAVALWEQSGKTIYLKSADATGKPTLRVFDLIERTETASPAKQAAEVKAPDYATKNELSSIAEALNGICADIEQMKSDLYGVAGRKKSSKKEVVEDDA